MQSHGARILPITHIYIYMYDAAGSKTPDPYAAHALRWQLNAAKWTLVDSAGAGTFPLFGLNHTCGWNLAIIGLLRCLFKPLRLQYETD